MPKIMRPTITIIQDCTIINLGFPFSFTKLSRNDWQFISFDSFLTMNSTALARCPCTATKLEEQGLPKKMRLVLVQKEAT